MRFLRLALAYPGYLERFYGSRPGLASEPYSEQYQALMRDHFGWGDSWSRALAPLGFEAWEPVVNAEPLQRAWARENGEDPGQPLQEIVLAQVARYRPDLLLLHHAMLKDASSLPRLREAWGQVKCVLVWCGSPVPSMRALVGADLILTNVAALEEDLAAAGLPVARLHHAFDPAVATELGPPGSLRPFTFVGSLVLDKGYHRDRQDLLRELVSDTPIEIFSEAPRPSGSLRLRLAARRAAWTAARALDRAPWSSTLLSASSRLARYATLDKSPMLRGFVDPSLVSRLRPAVYGLAMFRLLRDSLVTLNVHLDTARINASNLRLFEATGVGACLLTEHQPDLGELFEPDVEVVTYTSAEEAKEKASYLLAHSRERASIAAAGQRRTLARHTFTQRADQLLALLRARRLF